MIAPSGPTRSMRMRVGDNHRVPLQTEPWNRGPVAVWITSGERTATPGDALTSIGSLSKVAPPYAAQPASPSAARIPTLAAIFILGAFGMRVMGDLARVTRRSAARGGRPRRFHPRP